MKWLNTYVNGKCSSMTSINVQVLGRLVHVECVQDFRLAEKCHYLPVDKKYNYVDRGQRKQIGELTFIDLQYQQSLQAAKQKIVDSCAGKTMETWRSLVSQHCS